MPDESCPRARILLVFPPAVAPFSVRKDGEVVVHRELGSDPNGNGPDIELRPGGILAPPLGPLYLAAAFFLLTGVLAFANRGKFAQGLLLLLVGLSASVWLFLFGFTVMEKASSYVRQVAVVQVVMILGAMIVCVAVDIFLYRNAESLGKIKWGHMHGRSQFALILLCTFFVMNMGLMGYIRSGLRKEWHVVGVLKDTSEWASTPTNLTMALMVSAITVVFLGTVSFVFWISSLAAPKKPVGEPEE